MALSNFLRWPNETPSFSRSSSVKSGRTEYSILFSANVWAYWPRPCLPSHSAMSVVGLAIWETLTYDRVSLQELLLVHRPPRRSDPQEGSPGSRPTMWAALLLYK